MTLILIVISEIEVEKLLVREGLMIAVLIELADRKDRILT